MNIIATGMSSRTRRVLDHTDQEQACGWCSMMAMPFNVMQVVQFLEVISNESPLVIVLHYSFAYSGWI